MHKLHMGAVAILPGQQAAYLGWLPPAALHSWPCQMPPLHTPCVHQPAQMARSTKVRSMQATACIGAKAGAVPVLTLMRANDVISCQQALALSHYGGIGSAYLCSKQGQNAAACANIHHCSTLEVCSVLQDGCMIGACPSVVLQGTGSWVVNIDNAAHMYNYMP